MQFCFFFFFWYRLFHLTLKQLSNVCPIILKTMKLMKITWFHHSQATNIWKSAGLVNLITTFPPAISFFGHRYFQTPSTAVLTLFHGKQKWEIKESCGWKTSRSRGQLIAFTSVCSISSPCLRCGPILSVTSFLKKGKVGMRDNIHSDNALLTYV